MFLRRMLARKTILAFLVGAFLGLLSYPAYRVYREHFANAGTIAESTIHKARRDFFAAEAARDEPIAFLGDSLTDFWRDYPDTWNFQAVNLGVAGETINQLRWRIRQGEIGNRRIVVVMIGANDLGMRRGVEAIVTDYRGLLDDIRKQTGAKIICVSVLPLASVAPDRVRQVNERIAALLTGDMRFADLSGAFVDQTLFEPDGVHLSRKGYATEARLLDEYLR